MHVCVYIYVLIGEVLLTFTLDIYLGDSTSQRNLHRALTLAPVTPALASACNHKKSVKPAHTYTY